MSKPRYRWWPYVKNVIRAWPSLQENSKDRQERAEWRAVRKATDETLTMDNGALRMEIIKLVYWNGSHTVEGAGMRVGYQPTQAKKINGEYIRLVAANLGLLKRPTTRAKRKE